MIHTSRFQILRGKSPSISQKWGDLSTVKGTFNNKCCIRFCQIWGDLFPLFTKFGGRVVNLEGIPIPCSRYNPAYRASPKTVLAIAHGRLIFGNISYFVWNISFFQCFYFLRNIDNYLRGVSENPGTVSSKQYVFSSQKRIGWIYAIAFELNLVKVKVDLYGQKYSGGKSQFKFNYMSSDFREA